MADQPRSPSYSFEDAKRRLWETTALSRGHNVQVFGDLDSAAEWLSR